MAILVDTNILLHSLNPSHPRYAAASQALTALRLRHETLCIGVQNIVEFWAVATRPASTNGLGMTAGEAESEIVSIRRLFHLLPLTPEVLETWRNIVARYSVPHNHTHAVHLVALMQVHAVTAILTFNGADFQRFEGITVLDPAQVVA